MLKSLGVTIANVAERISGDKGGFDDLDATFAASRRAEQRRQRKTVVVLFSVFVVMVAVFSALFHELMAGEGRTFSWPTSVYWTLTTMTTLGFGDITFESDAGRIFSVVVLLSGSTFLLVVLPFVFIQFLFIPWMHERDRRRAPRSLPASTRGHIILTAVGPVEEALIDDADQAEVPYVILVDDLEEAGRLHDVGRSVMVGPLDDPATYERARASEAAMVVASRDDQTNTNIAFTVREIAPDVEIVTTANRPASVDVLEIAGADRVIQLGEVLGTSMAARALGLGGRSHVIGEFAGLRIAEAGVDGTDLVDRTLAEARLRERFGLGLIGVWDRGGFEIANAATVLRSSSLLLLAGSTDQLARFDGSFDHPGEPSEADTPKAVVIGGGRVGRAVGAAFAEEGVEFTIIEQLAEREGTAAHYVIGDAADRAVLTEAGIDDADAVLITTHDDNVNVYLTRYCRGLRPDIRIVARSRLDRNVSTLYRAGADSVLSYADTGSTAIWNHLRRDELLVVAHGLHVFRSPMPRELVGETLAEAGIRARTSCNVVAIETADGIEANPDAHIPLPADAELLLVGTDEAKARFTEVFPHAFQRGRRRGRRA